MSGEDKPSGSPVAIATALIIILLVGGVQYFLSRPGAAPTATPSPLASPVGADFLQWPTTLEGLMRMNQDPRLALAPPQAQRMVTALDDLQKAIKPFMEFDSATAVVLEPRQLTAIEDTPPSAALEQRVAAAGGDCPLVASVLASLERPGGRSGLDPRLWRAQLAYITPSPGATPTGVSVRRLRSRQLLWGILVLNEDASLALSADQAQKLLPWVRPLPAACGPAERAYEGVLAVLSEEQRGFLDNPAATAISEIQVPPVESGKDPLLEAARQLARQQSQKR